MLSRHLSGEVGKNHENPQSGYPVSGRRFELRTSLTRGKALVSQPWRWLGRYVKRDLGWCDSHVRFGYSLYKVCIEMDRLGYCCPGAYLYCRVVPCFARRERQAPDLRIHHCPDLQKKKKIKEWQGRWKRITLKPVGSSILFVMVSRVFLVVWASPLSVQSVIRQGLPVYLKVVCHCFPSVTLSPLLASRTTET